MNPRVVLDTNILLDLLYFKDQRVTDLQYALQNKTLDFWVSPPILAEYNAVLLRPQFQLSLEHVHEIIHQIQQAFYLQESYIPTSTIRCSDPDDQMFIDLAIIKAPSRLVSKDKQVLLLNKKLLAQAVSVDNGIQKYPQIPI